MEWLENEPPFLYGAFISRLSYMPFRDYKYIVTMLIIFKYFSNQFRSVLYSH